MSRNTSNVEPPSTRVAGLRPRSPVTRAIRPSGASSNTFVPEPAVLLRRRDVRETRELTTPAGIVRIARGGRRERVMQEHARAARLLLKASSERLERCLIGAVQPLPVKREGRGGTVGGRCRARGVYFFGICPRSSGG